MMNWELDNTNISKKNIQNLFKMLEENYQIPIPTSGKKAA